MSLSIHRNACRRVSLGLPIVAMFVLLPLGGCKSLSGSHSSVEEPSNWPASIRTEETIPRSDFTAIPPNSGNRHRAAPNVQFTAGLHTNDALQDADSMTRSSERIVRAQSPNLEQTPGNANAFRAPMMPAGGPATISGGPTPVNHSVASFGGQQPPILPGSSPIGAAQAPILPQAPISPSDYFNNPAIQYGNQGQTVPPLDQPWRIQPDFGYPASPSTGFQPQVREAPVNIYLQEAQTGRFVFGGSVNTDLGVAGQVIVEERNFDITRLPTGWNDLFNGAFRGNGENFRLELMPGNRVQRYSVNWTQPNLFGYSPWSLSLGGYYFNRIYRDWDEQRLGGRGMLGYQINPDLSISTELRGENVKIYQPRVVGVPALDNVVGSHELYTSRFRLAHETRDSPFLPTEGHFLELIYDQVFGSFDYPRGQVNYSKYFLIRERADGGGRHTLTSAWKLGFSGSETPLFENFFAGGFTTMRGFSFRGASPVDGGVQVGGRFMFLGSLEYMFPLTADDMLRMVTFVDYGTIERNIELTSENFRVSPGLGFRVAIPALGPGPLAFDFAYPVAHADTDDRQVFSFSVGVTR